MKRIKTWFMDVLSKWFEAVWNHKRKRDEEAQEKPLTFYSSGQAVFNVYGSGNVSLGSVNPDTLEEQLARHEEQRKHILAMHAYDALTAQFNELFLPAGWGLTLSEGTYSDSYGYRILARLKHGESQYLLIVFTEEAQAHVGLFPVVAGTHLARIETKAAVIHAQSKDELLLSMIAMSADEEKQYA